MPFVTKVEMYAWICPIVFPIILINIMAGYTLFRIQLLNFVRVSTLQLILVQPMYCTYSSYK